MLRAMRPFRRQTLRKARRPSNRLRRTASSPWGGTEVRSRNQIIGPSLCHTKGEVKSISPIDKQDPLNLRGYRVRPEQTQQASAVPQTPESPAAQCDNHEGRAAKEIGSGLGAAEPRGSWVLRPHLEGILGEFRGSSGKTTINSETRL